MLEQGGRCYYCGLPMWSETPDGFRQSFGLTARQARLLQCTAEHLRARCEGGRDSEANIVAACRFCNRTRHEAAKPRDPEDYRARVRRRMGKGSWHPVADAIQGDPSRGLLQFVRIGK
ncbi:HNH endonuclease [Aestuariicoccus sp. MJ-SS9]|uniref:HNH endonuclease n=1 Tax=Aestuariicoccus sp. MJ-SS9 TaxID=3079855 RepID=UPI002907466D|nr:HNH endonuclease [Aestuariicoccus sp. MJ-SS9]MDU8911368.1 HNH endonuclease [Aestuariicoccus sp. MJ-SS9]